MGLFNTLFKKATKKIGQAISGSFSGVRLTAKLGSVKLGKGVSIGLGNLSVGTRSINRSLSRTRLPTRIT